MSADEDEPHIYLSTACFHDLHDRCRLVCKFCDQPCLCLCHRTASSQNPTRFEGTTMTDQQPETDPAARPDDQTGDPNAVDTGDVAAVPADQQGDTDDGGPDNDDADDALDDVEDGEVIDVDLEDAPGEA